MSIISKLTFAAIAGVAAYYAFEGAKPTVTFNHIPSNRQLPSSFDEWWDYATDTQVPKVTRYSIEAKQINNSKYRIQPVVLNGCRHLMVLFNPSDKSMGILVQDPDKGGKLTTTIGCYSSIDVSDYEGKPDVVGSIVSNYGLRGLI